MKQAFDIRLDEAGNILMPTLDEVNTSTGGLVDLYGESATQLFPLGTKVIQGDRVFRYAKAGSSAPGIGIPTQGAAPAHANMDDDIAIPTATTAVPMTIGARLVHVTMPTTNPSSTAANYYKDGYIYFNNKGNGGGQCCRIKSHPVAAHSTTCIFTLYDPLTIALTPATDVAGLIKNPYNAVVATPGTTTTNAILGVPIIAPTNDYYFWLQSGGIAPVLCHDGVTVGSIVVTGIEAGEAQVMPTNAAALETLQIMGSCALIGQTDKHTLVYLTIDR